MDYALLDDRRTLLAAHRLFGLSNAQFSTFALRTLDQASPSHQLALAITDRHDDPAKVDQLVLEFLGAEGGPLSIADALEEISDVISKLILESEMPPLDGAAEISRAARQADLRDFHELDEFIYADSEADWRQDVALQQAVVAAAQDRMTRRQL
jgi:hypothetical protein